MGDVDYNAKIHKLNFRIARLKKQKRFKEEKENKKKRRERARKLLKLGLIFEFTLTTLYSTELILGYLSKFKDNIEDREEYFSYIGNKLLQTSSLEKHDKKEILLLDTAERKARNHKLISLGALFELTNTMSYSLVVKIGYIDEIHNLNEKEIFECELIGRNIIKNRRIKNGRNVENLL